MYNKNVEISSLEQQYKLEMERISELKDQHIEELQTIIQEQEDEITKLMSDHRIMVDTFREVSFVGQANLEER